MKSMMQNEALRIQQRHLEELEKYPNASWMIDEVYLSQLKNHNTNFVGILNNSALVAAVSIFENVFKEVCEYAAIRKHKPRPEFRHEIVKHCKKFIKDKCEINLDEIEEHWPVINNGILVRHLITHENAILPETKYEPKYRAVVEHIKNNNHFKIKNPRSKGPKQFMIIDHLYIFDFLTFASDYLVWIVMQLPHRKPAKRKTSKVKNLENQILW